MGFYNEKPAETSYRSSDNALRGILKGVYVIAGAMS